MNASFLRRWRHAAAAFTLYLAAAPGHAGAYEDYFRAINTDNASAIRGLLSRGFDPNTPDPKGLVGLFLALREPAPAVLELLLAHPQTQADAANAAGETPLMMAALRGNLEAAKQLLARGAEVHREGWSPVHYAACAPDTAVLRLLLDKGAPLEARSPNGTTPLMMASRYGPETAVDLLLDRGADLRARNVQELNAADFAKLGAREKLETRLRSLTPTN